MTVTEALVGGAIALALGVVMVRMLSAGLGTHGKAVQSRDAEAGVRNLLGQLVAELRSAAVPPLSDPATSTPVFWPGVWGAEQELANLGPFYPREERLLDDGVEGDTATNRLLYVRVSESVGESAASPLDGFVLVELLVPEERPSVLERRIHSLNSTLLQRRTVTTASGSSQPGWVLDPAQLQSYSSPGEPDILYDAGPGSRVALRVSHRTFKPVSDPGRTRYPDLFDPGAFKLEVAVALQPKSEAAALEPWPDKTQWSTLREETTEIRIPAVRQN